MNSSEIIDNTNIEPRKHLWITRFFILSLTATMGVFVLIILRLMYVLEIKISHIVFGLIIASFSLNIFGFIAGFIEFNKNQKNVTKAFLGHFVMLSLNLGLFLLFYKVVKQ